MPVRFCLFTGCAAVLSELFFVKTKQQISGNTLCITGDFCEAWAEKSPSNYSPKSWAEAMSNISVTSLEGALVARVATTAAIIPQMKPGTIS